MWFYIVIENPKYLFHGFFFFFFNLFFFWTTRYYLFAKSFIILSCVTLFYILTQYYVLFINFTVFNINLNYTITNFTNNADVIDFNLSFQINKLTYLFSLLVLFIGFCTNMYALNYFKYEADEMGFLFWLNSFIFSMIILIFSSNFFTLFLGWELIGFTSFFLINFWQSRRATLKSSFKAFSFNLISDVLLLGALAIFYINLKTTSIETTIHLVSQKGFSRDTWLQTAAIMLIGCASIKSVQILGHLWLPDSMEAPVPASALIHSATLVSAGIFLLLRFNEIIFISQTQNIILSLGSITAAYGGVVASAQTDMKKLLAYSTMSHCGFLFILVSIGDLYITIVYLFLHGLFKAATFFCAGTFIRVYGSQDTRLMGQAHKLLWGDTLFLIICAVNLCGLPFTVGITYKMFFFKAIFLSNFNFLHIGFIYIGMLSSVVYFYRLLKYTLFDRWKLLWGNNPFFIFMLRSRAKRDKRIRTRQYHREDSHVIAFGTWFSIFVLMVFSFYVYFYIYYFNGVHLRDDNIIATHSISTNMLSNYMLSFYTNYLIFFYFFYLLIIILLLLITWRKNFFFYDKFLFFLYLIPFFFFIY